MTPLEAIGVDEVKRLQGLVFDLDGTVLTDGALTLEVYRALHALADAGLVLVACTGRSAAWGQAVQRQWPVSLCVTENGAVIFHAGGRLERMSPYRRGRDRARLLTIAEQLTHRFDDLVFADDNFGRISDITFDIGEQRKLPADVVTAVCEAAHALGARTFLSSIHLHITLDGDDKASGTVHGLGAMFGIDPTAARRAYAFVGDSGNDEPCFSAFATTFGVANIAPYFGRLSRPPRYVSSESQGAGFVAIANRILALRAV